MATEHWQKVDKGDVVVSNSPEGLWQQACDYFKHCDDNPIKTKKTLTTGREAGKQVESEYPRAYTVRGFCLYAGITEEYIRTIRFSQDKTNGFYIVLTKILYIIHIQNVELATVGIFNGIFVSKMLGMDKQDDAPPAAIRVEVVNGLPALAKSENEILEKLESENRPYENKL